MITLIMTQVSKRYLSEKVQKRMYEIFVKAVIKAGSKGEAVHFLTDLLSPTEQIMLAKRLAIAYLLINTNMSQRDVSSLLKVSLTTVGKISLTLTVQGSGYRRIVKSLVDEEKVEEIMNKILDVVTALPPKGRNWSTWRKDKEQAKRDRRKAF